MKSGFDYTEYKKWAEKIGVAESELKVWLKQFLLTQAQRVVALAKKRQQEVGAIDTGAMINSWYIGGQKIALKYSNEGGKDTFELDKENTDVLSIAMVGDNLEVEIGNPMEYASFIEYGQRSYTGKYLLTIAIDTVEKQLPARFNKAWLQFIKSKGVV